MEQTPLIAQNRTVLGKKVKNLRKDGFIPAHVFGNQIETSHVQVKAGDFAKVFEKVGETGIIALTIDGKQKPVMVRDTQVNPISDDLYHIDFYQVNLSEKVKVNVPLEIVGESPAVEKKIGLLLTPVTEVEVEALPGDLPENIEIDITGLTEIDDEIKVKDLKVDRSKIEILVDEELVVAQIGELVTKEMEALEAEVEAEAAETVAAAAPTEGEEGAEPPDEGETAAEGEGKTETTKEEPHKE
jgi:large subunit ribosomal protein L25